MASLVAQLVKNLSANAGDTRDVGSILGSERSSGEGNGNPLQYSCLENSMHRQKSLAGYIYSPWGLKELYITKRSPHIQVNKKDD